MDRFRQRSESVLTKLLADDDPRVTRLRAAMRYSSLGGGKRLRPCLVYSTGQALGAELECLDAAAAAVELIHVYSLVHDDLPAMDNDDLRRGRPSCHRAFDEATAILAGDALQALAFEVLANGHGDPAKRLAMIQVLAARIGTRGMAGGQAIDLGAVGQTIAAGHHCGATFDALSRYARDLGLAFQIQDDILDVEGSAETLGKAAGADAALRKPTWPSLHGLGPARQAAEQLRDRACDAIASLGSAATALNQLAEFVVLRRH